MADQGCTEQDDGYLMHEHTEECDHDKEVGRTTQNVVHPFAMIDWEPAPGIETVPDDSSINGRFTRFEKHVIAKKNYAWDDWSKIRGYVPRRMHDIIRSMWEGYWKSAAMGPEPFETVVGSRLMERARSCVRSARRWHGGGWA